MLRFLTSKLFVSFLGPSIMHIDEATTWHHNVCVCWAPTYDESAIPNCAHLFVGVVVFILLHSSGCLKQWIRFPTRINV